MLCTVLFRLVVGYVWYQVRTVCVCVWCFFFYHLYFPLVGGFTLSDLMDNLWSQVSSLLPPGIGYEELVLPKY